MVTNLMARSLYRFLRWQLYLSAGFASLVLLLKGWPEALYVLAGAMVAIVGSLAYTSILRKSGVVRPVAILRLHIMAELAKLAAMFLITLVLYFWVQQLDWFWVVAGFIAAYSAYWLGLLIKS